jgi:hypothetical protein
MSLESSSKAGKSVLIKIKDPPGVYSAVMVYFITLINHLDRGD